MSKELNHYFHMNEQIKPSNDSKWKNMGATIGSSDVALCWLQLPRPLSSSSLPCNSLHPNTIETSAQARSAIDRKTI